jgi:hypothetical protein
MASDRVGLSSKRSLSLIDTRIDHEVVAKLAELDMVVTDLEHANTRVATLERRNVRHVSQRLHPVG